MASLAALGVIEGAIEIGEAVSALFEVGETVAGTIEGAELFEAAGEFGELGFETGFEEELFIDEQGLAGFTADLPETITGETPQQYTFRTGFAAPEILQGNVEVLFDADIEAAIQEGATGDGGLPLIEDIPEFNPEVDVPSVTTENIRAFHKGLEEVNNVFNFFSGKLPNPIQVAKGIFGNEITSVFGNTLVDNNQQFIAKPPNPHHQLHGVYSEAHYLNTFDHHQD